MCQESLENLTKAQLLALLQKKENSIQKAEDRLAKTEKNLAQKEQKYIQKISDLEFQLAQYKRLVFGQKRERFEKADENQLSLPFEIDSVTTGKQEEQFEEKRTKKNQVIKGVCHFLTTFLLKK